MHEPPRKYWMSKLCSIAAACNCALARVKSIVTTASEAGTDDAVHLCSSCWMFFWVYPIC